MSVVDPNRQFEYWFVYWWTVLDCSRNQNVSKINGPLLAFNSSKISLKKPSTASDGCLMTWWKIIFVTNRTSHSDLFPYFTKKCFFLVKKFLWGSTHKHNYSFKRINFPNILKALKAFQINYTFPTNKIKKIFTTWIMLLISLKKNRLQNCCCIT